jgi:hypothetical protein
MDKFVDDDEIVLVVATCGRIVEMVFVAGWVVMNASVLEVKVNTTIILERMENRIDFMVVLY